MKDAITIKDLNSHLVLFNKELQAAKVRGQETANIYYLLLLDSLMHLGLYYRPSTYLIG